MKHIRPTLLAAAALLTVHAHAELLEKSMTVGRLTFRYKLVLPDGYDQEKVYPAVLAFGGGSQDMNSVNSVINRNLRAQAEKRGYIVFAPAVPNDGLFFDGDAGFEHIFPEFLEKILAEYKIERRKFHITGPSNGGINALYIASRFPQYFSSVTAYPGYLSDATNEKLDALSHMCVFLYVGENDEFRWHAEMEREVLNLRSKGTNAHYTVEAGQPHGIATLQGAGAARLFNDFDESNQGCNGNK
jgi:predicted peptidase